MNSARMALHAVRLLASRGTLTVTELARELAVAPSTAHRVLTNCVAAGFARQEHGGGPYLPAKAMHEITLSITSAVTLRDAAGGQLAELRERTGLTTSMLVLEGRAARFVQSLEGFGPQRAGTRLGRVLPAHCTSGGKAMLAFCSPDDLGRRYPGHRLEGLTARSVVDWDCLVRELTRIRLRGWAANIGESDRAVTGIGAPVLLGSGEPAAAVTLAAAASHVGTRAEIEPFVEPLLHAANVIQTLLRGSREGGSRTAGVPSSA
ncbi:IclR family transcriptional regulator [Amycolatopsis acidiphila]|uniref:IclR family transcriptional regulator n=1 Tax=Amycolatopsis acidiphila TaxID=715473 RepID=A0A558AG82_9PSEU|nr:IclR family transcriptional regulator [Amycolatopsis acidiphila]TVT23264.1 IclR family transcriptional regulator [Amycolatopsis acidiphila]UIJ56482.1 IclR family transcriptional regulator [Amycolatopsis acidiphila]GHG67014.1 transcriptional regulator [Amycolatopsis acidiphila]